MVILSNFAYAQDNLLYADVEQSPAVRIEGDIMSAVEQMSYGTDTGPETKIAYLEGDFQDLEAKRILEKSGYNLLEYAPSDTPPELHSIEWHDLNEKPSIEWKYLNVLIYSILHLTQTSRAQVILNIESPFFIEYKKSEKLPKYDYIVSSREFLGDKSYFEDSNSLRLPYPTIENKFEADEDDCFFFCDTEKQRKKAFNELVMAFNCLINEKKNVNLLDAYNFARVTNYLQYYSKDPVPHFRQGFSGAPWVTVKNPANLQINETEECKAVLPISPDNIQEV